MEKTKYIHSDKRLYVKIDRMELGIDDAMLDFYFLEEELEGDRCDFIKAVAMIIRRAIEKVSFYKVTNHNISDCIQKRYIRMFVDGVGSWEDMKKVLFDAIELIQTNRIIGNDEKPNVRLAKSYESDIKQYVTEIKEKLLTGDFDCREQFIPCN